MSSFKRKATGKQAVTVYPGTRISPASNQTVITSTGISSLDDILGGGLPLSCSLVCAAPDIHSSYGDMIQKYFIAQGLACGHRMCVVGEDPRGFVKDLMWVGSAALASGAGAGIGDTDDEEEKGGGEGSTKVKIAWRYEKMKQFKTTVGSSSSDGESYCQTFELSSGVPEEVIHDALKTDRLHLIDVSRDENAWSPSWTLGEIVKYMASDRTAPVRVCIPNLGSPAWGDVTAQNMVYFLHSLRARLGEYGHGCASTSLPPQMSTPGWGGLGWLEKVGWASDGLLTVSAFSGNPGLSSMFPSHHGLLQINRLPSPHTFCPPSDRFSTLRGLGSSGENNLAFKCTRKRLVFETLHLDVEGGTGPRRVVEKEIEKEGKKKKSKRVEFENSF